jgi:poly(A) polymerase
MDGVLTKMQREGLSIFLGSYSALDRYFRVKEPGSVHLLTDASLISLAKIFDDLEYTGMPFEDACLIEGNSRYVFRLVDRIEDVPPHAFTAQYLVYNMARDSFMDPRGIYRDLRQKRLVEVDKPISNWIAVMEAAKMVARYHYEITLPRTVLGRDDFEPTPVVQRELLVSLLTSRYSEKGLSLLYQSGFIERFWPELFEMGGVQHSKEYHPEGNVWEHTLESPSLRS